MTVIDPKGILESIRVEGAITVKASDERYDILRDVGIAGEAFTFRWNNTDYRCLIADYSPNVRDNEIVGTFNFYGEPVE